MGKRKVAEKKLRMIHNIILKSLDVEEISSLV